MSEKEARGKGVLEVETRLAEEMKKGMAKFKEDVRKDAVRYAKAGHDKFDSGDLEGAKEASALASSFFEQAGVSSLFSPEDVEPDGNLSRLNKKISDAVEAKIASKIAAQKAKEAMSLSIQEANKAALLSVANALKLCESGDLEGASDLRQTAAWQFEKAQINVMDELADLDKQIAVKTQAKAEQKALQSATRARETAKKMLKEAKKIG